MLGLQGGRRLRCASVREVKVGEKQELFSRCLPLLITKAHRLGFEVRLRDLWRSKEEAARLAKTGAGIANSLHCKGLAIDLYIRRPGGRILWSTESYRKLGFYWESLDKLCYWGGRTNKPGDRLRRDGGHFSITHAGVQ